MITKKDYTDLKEYWDYQRLLEYIKPDFVHVLMNGKIIKSGGSELAIELEKKGYESFN